MERDSDPLDDGAGWTAIEDSMAATELPPIPPSSDPERLLRYVLQILPRYTEMEMAATHLRLYSSTLEQDLEHARNHTRILTTELESEREKKQFLERYAAQIVKERNDLLHSRPSKKSKTGGAAHFTWHSCCKKSGDHTSDLMPSMAAFRGEKLQETVSRMRALQDEVRNQERLCQETCFLLKRAQRDNDSKATADRKHIQQLEKQLTQRSMLQASTERKLFEVESMLAKYDRVKERDMHNLRTSLEEANRSVEMLEDQCTRLRSQQGSLEVERDDLQDRLTHVMMLKDELAEQVERVTSELAHCQIEVESLQSEVRVLQSEEVSSIRGLYDQRIGQLQAQWAEREYDLTSQVDALRSALRSKEAMLNEANEFKDFRASLWKQQDVFRSESHRRSLSSASEDHQDHSSGSSFSLEQIGSSLSRSQLSNSLRSISSHVQDLHGDNEPDGPLHSTTQLDREMFFFSPAGKLADMVDQRQSENENENVRGDSDDESSGLLAEMEEMLKTFQDRRVEEEKKVADAEQALTDYFKARDEFRDTIAPFA